MADDKVPVNREEVMDIAECVRKQAEEIGRERDPDGKLFFEVHVQNTIDVGNGMFNY